MVTIEKSSNRFHSRLKLLLILLVAVSLIELFGVTTGDNGMHVRAKNTVNSHRTEYGTRISSLDALDNQRAELNAGLMRAWRKNVATGRSQVPVQMATSSPVQRCKHVFLDLGSNVGDALHKVIDSFLPAFNDKQYIFNTTTGEIGPNFYGASTLNFWTLPGWVKEQITAYNRQSKQQDPVYPEDYCFYGVEGNPYFTSMLREQEIQVLNMIPRPVRHVHFLTEHVGSARDGPTTLFLDTNNRGSRNFVGSSILSSHVDVTKGDKKNGELIGVSVMGVTLTTLLEKTVAPGGHVMIKIDIEGAEYELLEEAVKSDIFCKLVQDMGVRVDIISEFHDDGTIGSTEPRQRWEQVIQGEQAIHNCGVNYKVIKSFIPIW